MSSLRHVHREQITGLTFIVVLVGAITVQTEPMVQAVNFVLLFTNPIEKAVEKYTEYFMTVSNK